MLSVYPFGLPLCLFDFLHSGMGFSCFEVLVPEDQPALTSFPFLSSLPRDPNQEQL